MSAIPVCTRRSGSNTRSGYRPTRFCRAGSAICSRAQSDDLRTMCAGSIRPEPGPSRGGAGAADRGGIPVGHGTDLFGARQRRRLWVGIHKSSPGHGDSGPPDITEVALAECIC